MSGDRRPVRPARSWPVIRAPIAVVLALLGLAACSSGQGSARPASPGASSAARSGQTTPVGSAAGACAFIARFRGHWYDGNSVQVEPVPGRTLGWAMLPGCDDTGGSSPEPDERLSVAELPGVDPDVAVALPDRPDMVLLRRGMRPPPEVERLLHAPRCDPGDAPIFLRGPWWGISDADGGTERGLVPPYDLEMVVRRTSASTYDRAHLSIRVPASLDRPLTLQDVKSSLWKGGTIAVTATCAGGRFLAQRVWAFPPS